MIDGIRRSWVRFPPKSRTIFFESYSFAFPYWGKRSVGNSRAPFSLKYMVNSEFHILSFVLPAQHSYFFLVSGSLPKSKYVVYSCFEKGCPTESIKAYATIPKGMMGCGCSLLHRQVHEFSARWKAVL